jgi:hypothetical protein
MGKIKKKKITVALQRDFFEFVCWIWIIGFLIVAHSSTTFTQFLTAILTMAWGFWFLEYIDRNLLDIMLAYNKRRKREKEIKIF